MAQDYYRDVPPRPSAPISDWAALVVLGVAAGLIVFAVWGSALPQTIVAPAAQPTAFVNTQPTLAPAARQEAQQAAPETAQENLPVATPQANQYPAAPPVEQAPAFSPQDLGNVPVPTAASSLPPEQQEAAAAASEMADLANAQAGLTPAQLAVKVHDACWNAGGCGVVK